MEDCIFCKIVRGEIPSYTVYQDDRTLAFLDINPNTLGHSLVIPKQHARTIIELDDADVSAVFSTVRKVVKGIQATVKPQGFNLIVNQGEMAGQIIDHFHCHIMPRTTGDGVDVVIKGITLSPEEFQELAKQVSENIQ